MKQLVLIAITLFTLSSARADTIEARISYAGELQQHWLVVVRGSVMSVLPAEAVLVDGSWNLSAEVRGYTGDELTGAVALTKDGVLLSSPLKRRRVVNEPTSTIQPTPASYPRGAGPPPPPEVLNQILRGTPLANIAK